MLQELYADASIILGTGLSLLKRLLYNADPCYSDVPMHFEFWGFIRILILSLSDVYVPA